MDWNDDDGSALPLGSCWKTKFLFCSTKCFLMRGWVRDRLTLRAESCVLKIVCSQANYIKRNINVYEPLKERMNNGAKAQQPPQSPPPPQTAARKPALRRLRCCLQPSPLPTAEVSAVAPGAYALSSLSSELDTAWWRRSQPDFAYKSGF